VVRHSRKTALRGRTVTGQVTTYALPLMASALATINSDTQLLSAEDGLYLWTRRDSTLKLLHSVGDAGVARRSNDGRVHPSGTFWFSATGRRAGSTHSKGARPGFCSRGSRFRTLSASPPTAARASSPTRPAESSTVSRWIRGRACRSTGPCSSIEIRTAAVWMAPLWMRRVALDRALGWRSSRRLHHVRDLIRSVAVPARQPSCPVFVGPKLDRLLVVSALEGMDTAAHAADKDGGKTFLIEVHARGRPEPRIRIEV
jgi:sugar lactone lactonase YvrE